ncbi:MAG: YwnF family protein [Bacillus sp. (in: Bacteria)]|nr:YwnF family protein [Bacillus sp. (in: firmicutes)]
MKKLTAPIVRKYSIYSFASASLILFSVINLYFLFFHTNWAQEITMLIVYGVVGALGLALFKESSFQSKRVFKLGYHYMVNRMRESTHLYDYRKERYLQLINKNPMEAINIFREFLMEEQRMKVNNGKN